MICAETRKDLTAYLDGELAVCEAAAIEAHIAECPSCRQEMEALDSLGASLAALHEQTAPEALQPKVIQALRVASAKPESKRIAPVRLAVAFAAVLAIVLFFLPRANGASAMLARLEGAVAKTSSLHMVCTWYRPDDRRKTFVQREVWLDHGVGRWNEAEGTSALIGAGGLQIRTFGTGHIPAGASDLSKRADLATLLAGIVRLEGAGVRLDGQRGVQWRGASYDGLAVYDADRSGAPIRTIFMLDRATGLPVHGEQERQEAGRWRTEGLLRFEFGPPIAS